MAPKTSELVTEALNLRESCAAPEERDPGPGRTRGQAAFQPTASLPFVAFPRREVLLLAELARKLAGVSAGLTPAAARSCYLTAPGPPEQGAGREGHQTAGQAQGGAAQLHLPGEGNQQPLSFQ